MPLEDSPSLEEYRHGIPELPDSSARMPQPSRRTARRRRWWIIIGVLALAALALALWNGLYTGSASQSEEGFGTIVGRVVDAAGRPVMAEIIVEGSEISGRATPDGHFRLTKVPAGRRALLIGYMYMAREYFVTIRDGETVDIGQIVMPTSAREGGYGRLEWR